MNSLSALEYGRVAADEDEEIDTGEFGGGGASGRLASLIRQPLFLLGLPMATLGIAVLGWFAYSQGRSTVSSAGAVRAQCPKTEIFPFKTGCPTLSGCERYRPGVGSTDLYKFSVGWPFGEIGALHDSNVRMALNDAALQARFPHLTPAFVRRFLRAEDELESGVSSADADVLQRNQQRAIHVSLMYGCCVTDRELTQARLVVEQWATANENLTLPVRLTKLQCMQERVNSVTNIIVADDTTENALMRLNEQLANELVTAGVPVVIERSNQMPFHSTLLGFRTGNNQPIEPYLGEIAGAVETSGRELSLSATIQGKVHFFGSSKLDNDLYNS